LKSILNTLSKVFSPSLDFVTDTTCGCLPRQCSKEGNRFISVYLHWLQEELAFICHGQRTMIVVAEHIDLEYGPIPNVMAALPNIGGALCSTPQSLADAHY